MQMAIRCRLTDPIHTKLSPNVKIPKWEASPATSRGINTLKPVLALSPMPRAMALRVSIFISIAEGISFFLRDAISSDLIQQPGHFLIGISRTQRFDGQISPVAGFFDEAE